MYRVNSITVRAAHIRFCLLFSRLASCSPATRITNRSNTIRMLKYMYCVCTATSFVPGPFSWLRWWKDSPGRNPSGIDTRQCSSRWYMLSMDLRYESWCCRLALTVKSVLYAMEDSLANRITERNQLKFSKIEHGVCGIGLAISSSENI